jgi:hypothetical protein
MTVALANDAAMGRLTAIGAISPGWLELGLIFESDATAGLMPVVHETFPPAMPTQTLIRAGLGGRSTRPVPRRGRAIVVVMSAHARAGPSKAQYDTGMA